MKFPTWRYWFDNAFEVCAIETEFGRPVDVWDALRDLFDLYLFKFIVFPKSTIHTKPQGIYQQRNNDDKNESDDRSFF
jgi:hypothetical protein